MDYCPLARLHWLGADERRDRQPRVWLGNMRFAYGRNTEQ
jgi:hypothetical protein